MGPLPGPKKALEYAVAPNESIIITQKLLTKTMLTQMIYILCMYVCIYVCMYVFMYVCMYVRMYVCTYVRMYVCIYVRMYVCMNVCMYVCMHVHAM